MLGTAQEIHFIKQPQQVQIWNSYYHHFTGEEAASER